MLFSSIPFLYRFLPATLLVYFLAPARARNAVLLAASLLFYAWGERTLVLLFFGSIVLGWALGLLIERCRSRATLFLSLSVTLSLGLLGYFKYTDFLLSSVNGVLGTSIPLPHIALPIGISFYTFQLMSYTIDVYRGSVRAQRSLIDLGAYVALFPQLIAGPIVRYADVAAQLSGRSHSLDRAARGARRFVLGLSKKVLLANGFGELCTQFRAAESPDVLFFWLNTLAFTLQIYFDFSGYSDMAIGLGTIFGFDFPENFDHPYVSRSITEFWRRWHMTLGSWFRDYVYIPLGGNRCGLPRQLGNILVVWLLTGLWHGASWSFVLWGLYYAALLTLEKLWLKSRLDRHPVCGHLYVLAATLFGFTLFGAADLTQAAGDLAGLFSFGRLPFASASSLYALRSYLGPLLIGLVGATPLPRRLMSRLSGTDLGARALVVLEPLALALLLLTATGYLVDGSFNPFLYFRF